MDKDGENIPRTLNMCLEVVACASQVSRDEVLWVGCSIILLNEGVCRAIALAPPLAQSAQFVGRSLVEWSSGMV